MKLYYNIIIIKTAKARKIYKAVVIKVIKLIIIKIIIII